MILGILVDAMMLGILVEPKHWLVPDWRCFGESHHFTAPLQRDIAIGCNILAKVKDDEWELAEESMREQLSASFFDRSFF